MLRVCCTSVGSGTSLCLRLAPRFGYRVLGDSGRRHDDNLVPPYQSARIETDRIGIELPMPATKALNAGSASAVKRNSV